LAGTAFGGNNCAPVNVPEIAVRKLVSPLGVFTLLAVYLKTPFCERGKTVLTSEFVFFFGGRLMFAPSVSFVPGKVAFLNEFLGVVKTDFVQFYGHEFFLASFLRKADPPLARDDNKFG
jgi:hypothetical protein